MGRSTAGVRYENAKKDEKLPLTWRFSCIVDTAGQRLSTDFPEVRHFSVWINFCSVATSCRPASGQREALMAASRRKFDVMTYGLKKKTGNSRTENLRRILGKGMYRKEYYNCFYRLRPEDYFILLLVLWIHVFGSCLFGQYVLLNRFKHSQAAYWSSASLNMTGPLIEKLDSWLVVSRMCRRPPA